MIKRYLPFCLYLLILLCGLLSGCDRHDNLSDLRKYLNDIKKSNSPQTDLQPSPTAPTLPPVTFKADKVRPPFQLTQESADHPLQPTNSPLQSFPLSVLKFAGTSSDENAITAYILTPNNTIFQVRKGDVIGEHYGKIISIQPTLIEIEEQNTSDDSKGSRIVVLQLKDNNR